MEAKEKLYYLVAEYINGNYNDETFCDIFTVTYDVETDYKELNSKEKLLFEELCSLTSRFSSDENDLKLNSIYVSKNEVRDKALQIKNELIK